MPEWSVLGRRLAILRYNIYLKLRAARQRPQLLAVVHLGLVEVGVVGGVSSGDGGGVGRS
jgi:hypothetical protein